MEKRSKAETEEFYRELVADQEQSGLTLRAFAAARGMPAGTLSSWRHQLKKRDAAARASRRQEATKSSFVPVSVVGAGAVANPAAAQPTPSMRAAVAPVVYEVSLGRGRVLRVPADFDEARVAALVRAVTAC